MRAPAFIAIALAAAATLLACGGSADAPDAPQPRETTAATQAPAAAATPSATAVAAQPAATMSAATEPPAAAARPRVYFIHAEW